MEKWHGYIKMKMEKQMFFFSKCWRKIL